MTQPNDQPMPSFEPYPPVPEPSGPESTAATDAVTDTPTETVTEPAVAPAPAPAPAASSSSQARTVALVASVAALAGLAGGFAIRSAGRSSSITPLPASGSTQAGPRVDDGAGGDRDAGQSQNQAPAFGQRGGFTRDGGAVPAPFRGGGSGSTTSRGS